MTVDGGDWAAGSEYNDSEVWSEAPFFTQDPTGFNGRDLPNAFKGYVTLGASGYIDGANPPAGDATGWTINFGSKFPPGSVSQLSIFGWMDTLGNNDGTYNCLEVNGTSIAFDSTKTTIEQQIAGVDSLILLLGSILPAMQIASVALGNGSQDTVKPLVLLMVNKLMVVKVTLFRSTPMTTLSNCLTQVTGITAGLKGSLLQVLLLLTPRC